MKKLFLRDGKLMYGSSLDDQSAAEVVNLEAIGFGLSAEYKTFFIDGNEHNEPEMVDLPKGWTVEIDTIETLPPTWEARLVPITTAPGIVATGAPEAEQQAIDDTLKGIESKFAGSEIGSHHWAATLLSYVMRVGEYLNNHGAETKSDIIYRGWGQGIKERAQEVNNYLQSLPDKPVSPPSQESQSSLLNEIQHLLYNQGPIVGREEVLEQFTITRKTKP